MADFSRLRTRCDRHRLGGNRRASDAVVGESARRHDLGIVEIAPVDDDGILQPLVQTIQIQAGEFIPFGEDQESIGVASRFISVTGVFDARIQNFFRALLCRRIA